MALELHREHLVLRVDGDVLEVFRKGTFSRRIPLAWLGVQVQPSIRGKLILRIGCPPGDEPLYEALPKAKAAHGEAIDLVIGIEEEPAYRAFFAQVARSCGRA